MRAPAKLGAYAAVLVAVLAAGAGVGAAVGPLDDGDDAAEMPHEMDTTTTIAEKPEEGSDMPAGLSASEAGYTFAPDDTTFAPGVAEAFTFRILGPDEAPVTDFDTRHEQDLHLVVVSDDLADYQHLHPALSSDGTWSTKLGLPRAGGYRAYADFAAAGAEPLTLGVDLLVAGELAPQPLPAPASTATVDGYEVRLDGDVTAGAEGELRFTVARDGAQVTDLEPYLGAFGHLVAIRASDHAYLHVHPTEDSSPEEVTFGVHVPSPGAYRLFLDFQHEGAVRTASFTLDVPAGATTGGAHDEGAGGHGGH
ncbi:MAG: hypothetical protein GEV08_22935 [Acidimicrobiia bacterium]|nr:hypothetical protein [Acidimicrobiia bacterium]